MFELRTEVQHAWGRTGRSVTRGMLYDVIGGLGDAETLLQVLEKAIADRDAEWEQRFRIAD